MSSVVTHYNDIHGPLNGKHCCVGMSKYRWVGLDPVLVIKLYPTSARRGELYTLLHVHTHQIYS